jgi:GT2 family glycosyltransferase
MRQAGYRIRYVPSCAARHQGAHSLERISLEDKQVYWYGSLLSYTGKHFSVPARWLVRAAVALGAVLRFLASLGRTEERRSYRRVMVLALGRRTAKTLVQPHVLT